MLYFGTETINWREWLVLIAAVDKIDIARALEGGYSGEELDAFLKKNFLKVMVVKTLLFVNTDRLDSKMAMIANKLVE